MRYIPIALASHIARNATTLATCWKVTRTDGQIFGFTSHDEDLTINGITYYAATGITPSALASQSDLAVDNAEMVGALDSAAVTEADLRAGIWDHAEVRVFEVNWAQLDAGVIKQIRGWLGQVGHDGNMYKAELRSLASALNATIGEIVGPGCLAELGDRRCKVDMTAFTYTGTVTAVASRRVIQATIDTSPADGFCAGGVITMLTGANATRRMEVKKQIGTGIELQLPMPYDFEIGDTFTITAGCDKSLQTCIEKFDNAINFRGFPTLPGADQVTTYGGQV